MGIELARAYITVQADASRLDNGLNQVRDKVQANIDAMDIALSALLGKFASFGLDALKTGIGQAGFLETTTVEMETMLGSAKETQDTLAKLTKFAAETPFEMPQLLRLSRELITFGERGDEMMSTLKMLGDVSSGNAEKFAMVGTVFNQVRGTTKLLTQDFRQLSTRGVVSLQDIAKHYKTTTAAASKMLSDGKVSFDDFRKILEGLTGEGGRFANGMAKQARTMEGLKSTMNDGINIAKRFIAEPLVPYIKSFYTAVISLTDAMGPLIKQGGEVVSFAFVGATAYAGLRSAMYGAGVVAQFLGIRLSFVKLVLSTFKAGGIIAVGAALGALISYFKVPEKLAAGFKNLKDKIFGNKEVMNNFRVAWERIKETAGIVWKTILAYFEPFIGAANSTWDAFWKSFDRAVTKILVRFSLFAMDSAEWLQAIAMHAQDIYDRLPDIANYAFSQMVDVASNAGSQIVDSMKRMLRGIVEVVHQLSAEWEIFWENESRWEKGMGGLSPEGAKAMREAAKKNAEKAMDDMGLKLANKGLLDESPETKALKGKLKDLFDDIFDTKKELEKKRKFKPGGDPNKPGDDKKKAADRPAESLLKPGMFQIPELGRRLQESLLQKKDGVEANTAKMVELGGQQKALQEKQLKQLEKMNPGLK